MRFVRSHPARLLAAGLLAAGTLSLTAAAGPAAADVVEPNVSGLAHPNASFTDDLTEALTETFDDADYAGDAKTDPDPTAPESGGPAAEPAPGPTDPDVDFVKAMYDRPFGDTPGQGGRVTELVARPLLNLHWPRLAGFVQPLGGEYAARRSLLERLPFPVGYGVELGLLVDALHTVGLDALAQVDVGVRKHRHQDGQALGRMAAAIYRTAQVRLSRGHLVRPWLTQFERGEDGFEPRTYAVDTEERPPMAEITEYAQRRVA